MAANNHLVKKAYRDRDEELTLKQAQEYAKCLQDPFYFYENYVRIQHPTKGAVLFKPYKYQVRVLDAVMAGQKSIILQPRQSGKSANIVAYLLWEAIFHPDMKIGIAAHKGSGAKELIARVKYAYESLPPWLKPGVTSYNVFDVGFDNGSTIESATTTENTFRGMSMSIIYLDELAFVPPRIAEAFWTSLLPSLSAGDGDEEFDEDGNPVRKVKLIATSTPNGTEGLFARLWFGAEHEENDFQAVRVRNEEVPGRGPDFKAKMLKTMSPVKYRQEFGCEFLSDKGTLISSDVLEAIKSVDPIDTYRDMNLWGKFAGRRLGVSVDVAEGIGQDYSVIQVFDLDTFFQVGEYRDNSSGQTELAKKIVKFMEKMDADGAKEIYYTVEANPIGKGVLTLLENYRAPILDKAELVSEYKKKHRGILTTNKNKLFGCSKFKDLVEAGKIALHSAKLISELKFFVKSGASFKAESGMHDDLVMSCIVMMNMFEEISHMDDGVHENFNTLEVVENEDDEDAGIEEPLPFVF